MSTPHLCVVTSAHPVDDVRVRTKIVNSLLEAGWTVSWIGPDVSNAGDQRAYADEISYSLLPHRAGRIARLLSSLRLRRAARSIRGNVDWWYSPDPDAAKVATALARSRGGRSVFDIHEVYHTGHLDRWTGGRRIQPLSTAVRSQIRRTCRRADLVIAVSRSVLRHYADSEGDSAIVVRNCAPRAFTDASDGVAPPTDRLRIVHGKLATWNGTESVLCALPHLRTTSPVEVVVVSTPQWNDRLAALRSQLPDNVTLTAVPPMPHRDMVELTASCHLGLISYQRDLGLESLPNRLFEYMATGTAVLAPAYSPEIVEILQASDAGTVCDFEEPTSIAAAIDLLATEGHLDEMGQAARAAFLQLHSWEVEARRLLFALEAPLPDTRSVDD